MLPPPVTKASSSFPFRHAIPVPGPPRVDEGIRLSLAVGDDPPMVGAHRGSERAKAGAERPPEEHDCPSMSLNAVDVPPRSVAHVERGSACSVAEAAAVGATATLIVASAEDALDGAL